MKGENCASYADNAYKAEQEKNIEENVKNLREEIGNIDSKVPFIVNATIDDTTATLDKTADEIYTAFTENRLIVVTYVLADGVSYFLPLQLIKKTASNYKYVFQAAVSPGAASASRFYYRWHRINADSVAANSKTATFTNGEAVLAYAST